MQVGYNAFKNSGANVALYADTSEVTNIEMNSNTIAVTLQGMTSGKKLLNFDHSIRIVSARYQCKEGKASHAINVFNGTSSATKKISTHRPVADNVEYAPVSFLTANTVVEKGGNLVFTVSGASWAAGTNIQEGTLILETMPY